MFFAVERLLGALLRLVAPHVERFWALEIVSAAMAVACAYVILLRLVAASPRARAEHARFLAAAESSLDDFYIFDGVPDASGKIVDFRFNYLNPNAERRLNLTRQELEGKILTEVRPFMISSGLIEHYREVVRTGKHYAAEVFIDDDRIRATWINVQVVKLGDGIAITSRDITESKKNSDRITYLAHDHLTGLPNRALLRERLHHAILRAQRHSYRVAIFMLDIDRFKEINDTYGHTHGDALLLAVGKRLLSSVRETDTVARIGGDEFVIIMPDFKTLEDVTRCGQEIVEKTSTPVPIDDDSISITLSIGLCIYPDCGLDEEQLLKNADAAMYTVKARGRNGLHVYREGPSGEVESGAA
jgi:diguanylate cyclase (GGDEF)-like protein